MADVYVYVTEERYAEAGCCSTTELSDTVNVDRLAGDVVGVEVLGAHRVTVDGVDVLAEWNRLRDVLQKVADDTCRCEFQFLTYCSPCSVCVAREALLGDPPVSSADTTVDYPQIGPPRITSTEPTFFTKEEN